MRTCVLCGTDITTSYRPKNGPKCPSCVAEYQREYRKNNAARIAESKKRWCVLNAEHKAKQDREYAVKYPERRTNARKKWAANNPGADRAAKATNKAARKKRVPTWLSDEDKWMIAEAYELAALRTELFGFSWHVDHIIPLNGKKVSGLHVPANLQVVPWFVNLTKSNKYHVHGVR
jgi:hypothetical protein